MFQSYKVLKGIAVLLFVSILSVNAQVVYPGTAPGKAVASRQGYLTVLRNNIVELGLKEVGGKLTLATFKDKQSHQQLPFNNTPLFALSLASGEQITSGNFTLVKAPLVTNIRANEIAGRPAGKKCSAVLVDPVLGLTIHWEVTLFDGDNYIRQVFAFQAKKTIPITRLVLVNIPKKLAVKRVGTVDGSPLVHGNMFFAVEHPMSQTMVEKAFTTAYLPRLEPITAADQLTISTVFGVVPAGQLRRGFLFYVESQRARPYRQVLHYNSWFDLSWVDRKLSDSLCLNRIKVFTDSLIDKRKVKLDAFLFDDGWDDNKSLWEFNPGFPKGFTNLSEATKNINSRLGVWISPWGGYDEPKKQRLEFGKKQNPPFETNENGFSLTGKVYYNRFRDVTLSFIKKYNVSMFKFDGVGAGNGAAGASLTYQKDIESFLKLITELRSYKPDLYLSLTVGTWPSVYWLKYGDAIWRAGEDTGLAGNGAKRQQWITYKDAQTYKNIVKRAPLFPLNSIMYHGICIADNGLPGKLETDDKNISDEIWAFFGTGTGLQELYVNPNKLNTAGWNTIRDAANWSRAHKQALADIHWIGGDPAKGQVYGYAGWANRAGVLTLRNPGGTSQRITLKVRTALDIPVNFPDSYQFFDARHVAKIPAYSGNTITVNLAPYEVKVMNALTL